MAEEDLIFGKNRHFFGGMEPSNMTAFSASVVGGSIRITAKLPTNTVVNGQTLCTVAGAVIRRKTDGYPTDEFDGDLVENIKSSKTVTDSSASSTGTYYYAAFPYTTRGVYNRNEANRTSVNEPDPMVKFTASSNAGVVRITADIPSSASGAVIRRSTLGYPKNASDGELFMDITSDGVYTDNRVTVGHTYFYTAFPYTSSGTYSVSESNKARTTVKLYTYIFGYDLDTTDSDPSARVSYPSDVDNANYIPAYMDYAAGSFNYGSWPSAAGEKFMPRPCMLKYNGTVDHYLDPNDYTKKVDGAASRVSDTSFGGNAMMEWPKIYAKRWEDENGIYHFRCSDIKVDNEYECWCNYDKNNSQIEHFYTPIYFGSNVSSKMRSISGRSNLVSKTASEEITLAKANGGDWYIEVLADRLLIQDLLVMMAKSTDCQTAYGSGVISRPGPVGQGTMNTRGLFYGSNNTTTGVKVFGMENLWGNLNRHTAGWINARGSQKVKLTRGTRDGSTASDYNTDGRGYLTVGEATFSGTSGGYIKTMKTVPYGRIPFDASGSSTTYEADGLYFDNSGTMYAVVGGYYRNGLPSGPFSVSLAVSASNSSSFVGAALSCKPSAK